MKTMFKVMLGVVLGGLVLIVGCAVLVGTAADEAVDQLNAEQAAHAISPSTWDRFEIGMREARVLRIAGKEPQDRQAFEQEGIMTEEPERSSCIYYNREGGEFGDIYQLCFTNGRLESRNEY